MNTNVQLWQLGNFQSAALKAQCHIKCYDTKYNSKSLIILKIIKNLPSSVFNHRLNTSYTKYMS